jgi:predicted TIM-barrel fold metal-dependent hydrolase
MSLLDDDDAPLCQGPDPKPHPPGFALPPGATDCHAHVIGPFPLFGLQEDRSYTPPEAPLAAYRALLDTLGLERGVVVQPSVFGTDNACTLDALAKHRNRLRGIAVVDPTVSDETLERMDGNGIRGIRFNMLFRGGVDLDHLEGLARRIERFGWHIQLLIDCRTLPALAPKLARLPVDIVIDHMGHMPASTGIDHPGFRQLLKLVRDGRTWVKLSGANRTSSAGPPYHDTIPFAQALVDADPTRLVWGSDWPHVAIPGPMANDGDLLDLLRLWVPDERQRHLVLVENPARLYGFGD